MTDNVQELVTGPSEFIIDEETLTRIVNGIDSGRFSSFQEYGYKFSRSENGFNISPTRYGVWEDADTDKILKALALEDRIETMQKGMSEGVNEEELLVALFLDEYDKTGQLGAGNKAVILGIGKKLHIDNSGRVGTVLFRLNFSNSEAAQICIDSLSANPTMTMRSMFKKILGEKLPGKSKALILEDRRQSGLSTGVLENSDPFERKPEKLMIGIIDEPDAVKHGFMRLKRKSFPEGKTAEFKVLDGNWIEI